MIVLQKYEICEKLDLLLDYYSIYYYTWNDCITFYKIWNNDGLILISNCYILKSS